MSTLFTPLKLGKLLTKNRIFLAPMTRLRTGQDGVPNKLMEEYYSQRASFGLIVTECSAISSTGNSYLGCGSIYNDAQVEGWKRVTDKVHQQGGLILLQIFHGGRSGSKQMFGTEPVAPSAIAIDGIDKVTKKPYEIPVSLSKDQIKLIIQDFHTATLRSKKAGFDGVQIHGANGYLVDQFLRDGSNERTDEYGGSVENRSRFAIEVVDAAIQAIGADRVALRLSPTDRFNGMYDSNPLSLTQYLLPAIDSKGLAYVEIKKNFPFDSSQDKPGRGKPEDQIPNFFQTMKKLLKKTPYVANQSIDIPESKQLIESETADAISFGFLGISNPDLPIRIQKSAEINRNVDFTKAYGGGAEGYTDYPKLNEKK